VAGGALTGIGDAIRRLPLHPRLARMLLAAGGSRQMARACALLSERHFLAPRRASTTSDLLSALDDWSNVPPHMQSLAREIESIPRRIDGPRSAKASAERLPSSTESDFRRAVLAGYPDRVAQRRETGSAKVLLATGTGATMAAESGVRDGELLVALDVQNA